MVKKKKQGHISQPIAIHLESGEYDDALNWPFRHSVTIWLIDQKEGKNHHDHTFDLMMLQMSALKEEWRRLVIILDGEHHVSLVIQSFLQTTLSMTLSASVSFKLL